MTNPYAAPILSDATPIADPLATANEAPFFAWSGRIGRVRYFAYIWLSMALIFGGGLAVTTAMVLGLSRSTAASFAAWPPAAMGVLMIVASMVMARRRLQDLDTSPWLLLLLLVPFLNIVIGLRLLFGKGTPTANEYGSPPPPNSKAVWAMLLVALGGMLAMFVLPFFLPGASTLP